MYVFEYSCQKSVEFFNKGDYEWAHQWLIHSDKPLECTRTPLKLVTNNDGVKYLKSLQGISKTGFKVRRAFYPFGFPQFEVNYFFETLELIKKNGRKVPCLLCCVFTFCLDG